MDEVPEFYGWFDDDAPDGLPVEMLVIERAIDTLSGPWTVAGALISFGDAPPAWVDGYVDDYWSADAPQLWEYFVDKGGGNAYSYEIAFLRLRRPEDASAVLAHMESKLAEGHPLGLSAPVSPPMETVPRFPTVGEHRTSRPTHATTTSTWMHPSRSPTSPLGNSPSSWSVVIPPTSGSSARIRWMGTTTSCPSAVPTTSSDRPTSR